MTATLTRTSVTVRTLRAEDWPAVCAIFEQGIATGIATFETEAPSWEDWDASHLREHRLVGELDGDVAGWAALSPTSGRSCYAGVVEGSIYVAEHVRGRGVGKALLAELVARADRAGIWTIQTGVFPENTSSLALHCSRGFRVVGLRERIARLEGRWRDVVLLERRSLEVN